MSAGTPTNPVQASVPISVPPATTKPPPGPFRRWLLEGYTKANPLPQVVDAAHVNPHAVHKTQAWWKVMCLTGVDYFSTLGYQPGIAALAAGALAPLATLVLVLLTLAGALPVYRRVARESPHGEGSIAMLEKLLRWWQGKLFVLVMLGFVGTDFIITITLSAADATAHVIENPFVGDALHGKQVLITLVLIGLLAAVFLKGFREAVGVAVVLVAAYLALNAVVIGYGLYAIAIHPTKVPDWWHAMLQGHGGNPLLMFGVAMLLFPKLALGLSGFETGVAVMPLVKGRPDDTEERPEGRIRNTRKLLLGAAVIMSVFLLTSSLVTTLLIPPEAFRAATDDQPAGQANGRALAYLAHQMFGDKFGTVYDVSTITILWFAGASAMAGLLNIVPRYLPRYGMAPEWTRAPRPLVLVYTVIAFGVTLIFRADVNAQGGAYATGVLVLMTSAAVAVTISARRRKAPAMMVAFGLITVVFVYTTGANVVERPDGVKIAAFFITTIIVLSLISRIWRTLELRATRIEIDPEAKRFIDEALRDGGELRLIANRPETCDEIEYTREEREAREDHQIAPEERLMFVEVYVEDPSEFTGEVHVRGREVSGYRVLRVRGTAIPNAIAALLLFLRDSTGRRPHCYFNWSEGNPLLYLIRYILSGEGDMAPVTREILRQYEPDPGKRPVIHAAA